MKKLVYIFAIAILLAVGCTTDDAPDNSQPELIDVALSLTRAESDGLPLGKRTYRVLLYNRLTNKYTHYTGTYYDDDGTKSVSGVLRPAYVDSYGRLVDPDDPTQLLSDPSLFKPTPTQGLFAPTNDYYMVLVTPAVMPKQTSAILDNWGIYYPRYEKETGNFYVSKYVPVTLRSRGEAASNVWSSKQYDTLLVNLSTHNATLTEPRSRIRFTFACAGEVQESNITAVRLTNLIDYAWYDPGNGDFYIERGGVEYEMATPVTLSPPEVTATTPKHLVLGDDPWELPVKGSDIDESADGLGYVHVLSQDYSRRGQDNITIYPIFKLEIERDEDIAVLPLAYKMEPHYSYTFDVLIKSQVVHLSITATPWEDGNGVNTTGGQSSEVLDPYMPKFENIQVAPWTRKTINSEIND